MTSQAIFIIIKLFIIVFQRVIARCKGLEVYYMNHIFCNHGNHAAILNF